MWHYPTSRWRFLVENSHSFFSEFPEQPQFLEPRPALSARLCTILSRGWGMGQGRSTSDLGFAARLPAWVAPILLVFGAEIADPRRSLNKEDPQNTSSHMSHSSGAANFLKAACQCLPKDRSCRVWELLMRRFRRIQLGPGHLTSLHSNCLDVFGLHKLCHMQ